MNFATSDTAPSPVNLNSRVALALAYAAVDAETRQQATTFGSGAQGTDYVKQLIEECNQAWNNYTEHPFPTLLAKDAASLNGFRHYTIQDSLYLEHYYRLRTKAVSKSGTLNELKDVAAKLSKSLDWAISFRKDCTRKLGVPSKDVTDEPPSKALEDSIALHEEVYKNGDWLDIHIVLLPCILGYYTIASKLLYDPKTIRNTIYYPLWIQLNADGSSATNYKDFINKSIGDLPDAERKKRWPGWVTNFTKACGTEKAFFDLGIPSPTNKVPAYKVVKDGTYKIRNYDNGHFLVSKPDYTVVTKALQSNEGLWKLTNATDSDVGGYTIESVSGTQGSLTVSVGDFVQPIYYVNVSHATGATGDTKQQWPINVAVAYDNNGLIPAIQIFVPARLRYALDAGRNEADPKVFVTNNSQISTQVWVLESA